MYTLECIITVCYVKLLTVQKPGLRLFIKGFLLVNGVPRRKGPVKHLQG